MFRAKVAVVVLLVVGLAVSAVTAQEPAKVAPKHYKVVEVGNAASISSDGRYLFYTDNVQGDGHFFVRDLKTGESRQITQGPGEAGSTCVISPDGKHIAYDWVLYNEGKSSRELRISRVDGSGMRLLYRDERIFRNSTQGWSADSKQVLATFVNKDGRHQIVLVSVSDGSVRVLKTRVLKTLMSRYLWYAKMSFSPDGRYVAYEFPPYQGSPQRDIFLLPTDGGGEIHVVRNPANDRLLDWTPDGKGLLFASDRKGRWDAWVIQIANGKAIDPPELVQRNIGPPGRGLGFTRDGSYYYSRPAWENDVYVATLGSTGKLGAAQKLVSHVGYDTSPAWSRDGRYLAYARGSGGDNDTFVLGFLSVRTGSERQIRLTKLQRFGGHAFQLHWSPDGHSLLAQGRQTDYLGPGMDSEGLYRIDAKTARVTPIVHTKTVCPGDCIEWPAWSADGKVIFARWIRGPQSIVVREMETGLEKEIYRADSPARVSHLAISPDGQRLAFVWQDGGAGETALKVVPVSGGEARELVSFPPLADYWLPLFALAWTPDSRHLIYAPSTFGQPKFEFWQISAKGGEPRNLGLTVEGLLPFGLSVHPDGRRLAFTAGTPDREEVWVLKDFLPAFKKAK